MVKNLKLYNLNQQNIKQKRNLLAKLKLEKEISLYQKHILALEDELSALVIDANNIDRAIYISEQLTLWESKEKHYEKLIELYITKKDFKSAGESLAHALAIYPNNKKLLTFINKME